MFESLSLRDIISILTLFGVVFAAVFNKLLTDKIANNHLKHVDEKLDKITGKVDSIDKKVGTIKMDVAVLQEKTKIL